MWQELSRNMRDPRLLQLFGRYATYCGGSPFDSPATLSLVAHVEREGVWAVEGGMHGFARALARMGEDCGVTFRYNCAAKRIIAADGRACAVETQDSERIDGDAIVFNGDPNALADRLLGDEISGAVAAVAPVARSFSAVTFAMRAKTQGVPLLRHNVFFSDDYQGEFDDIRLRSSPPASPTVYVCAQDRLDDDATATGAERLFCILNAPAVDVSPQRKPPDMARCEDAMFDRLERCGLQVERSQTIVAASPDDFARLFPGSAGAIYGRAPHGWRASFQRPGARTAIRGLYLAGGATHPGPGAPMAALSGRQAALAVMEDLASMGAFRPAAIPGGMSMRSATTASTGSSS